MRRVSESAPTSKESARPFGAQGALEDLDSLELDDETRQLYLEGNARRVFNLPPGS
jgi:hypothetical protein